MAQETVADWALEHYPEIKKVGENRDVRPGIVHRLDRDTSGILLIARNNGFFTYFKGLLAEHQVEKRYLAILWGKLGKDGKIDASIALKSGTTRRTVHTEGNKLIKPALTLYRALKYIPYGTETFTLAELMPKTGRTHQLRVHMASIGHPVLGDKLYGRKKTPVPVPRQMLHAYSLQFETRGEGVLRLEAPLPGDFKSVLRALRK